MLTRVKNAKIGVKLPLVIGGLVGLTIAVMAAANAYLTSQIITQNAQEKLQSIAFINNKRISSLLDSIDRDIRLQADAPATSVALIALGDGYNSLENPEDLLRRVYIDENQFPVGEKDKLVSADTGSSYGFIHTVYHPTFNALQDEMKYYDVFLLDTEGNLVYSVFKGNDFATNMLTGEWSSSGLAEAYRLASELEPNARSVFVDFAPYGPGYDAPAAFVARPVFNEQGVRLGVIAYQMPVTELSSAAGDLQGLGQSADGFLVGSDGTMRTDSSQTEPVDILVTRVEYPAITDALEGVEGSFEAVGHHGRDVMGFAVPMEFLGSRWVTVVQQDKRELFAGLNSALIKISLISVAILGCALAFSAFFSRGFSRPLQHLTEAVNRIVEGALHTEVPCTDRGDEIGELARQTEVFRKGALRMEKMAEEQTEANEKMRMLNAERDAAAQREAGLAAEKERADRDAERARAAMMAQLGASFGGVISAACEGDFRNRVDIEFDDAVLEKLATDMNAFMQEVDNGLSRTGAVLSLVAAGDLTQKMEGEFKGAFLDLQTNVNGMLTSLTALVSDISESGDVLGGSSTELRQTADLLARQAEQNAASMQETSAALEELSASVAQVNTSISDVSTNAQEARTTASNSEKVAAIATASMERIAEGSKEITRVTEVINDIAFQINLLALNAGVEAARAGDAGRGFSVVASEVRLLAQRASEAAKEISHVLGESDAAVTEGVANVSNAKSALDGIASRVVRISESVDEVTRAVSEQASGINEISSAMAQVDGNTQKQAAAFEELNASSHVLAAKAGDLQSSTSQFRVSPSDKASARTKPPTEDQEKPKVRNQPRVAVGAEDLTGWDEF